MMMIYSSPVTSSWSPRTQHFTADARRVLADADSEARALGHHYLGTEHLIFGLLRDRDIAATLSRLGAPGSAVRRYVEDLIDTEPRGRQSPAGPLEWNGHAKRVIDDLVPREVAAAGHHYIGVEHLLLGLIRDGEGVAGTVLARLGVTLKAARRAALEGASS